MVTLFQAKRQSEKRYFYQHTYEILCQNLLSNKCIQCTIQLVVHIFRFSKKIFVFDVDVHLGILKMFPRTDISVRLYIYKEFRTKIEIFQFHSALHSRESFNLEKPIFSIIFHILQEKAIKSFGKVSFFINTV